MEFYVPYQLNPIALAKTGNFAPAGGYHTEFRDVAEKALPKLDAPTFKLGNKGFGPFTSVRPSLPTIAGIARLRVDEDRANNIYGSDAIVKVGREKLYGAPIKSSSVREVDITLNGDWLHDAKQYTSQLNHRFEVEIPELQTDVYKRLIALGTLEQAINRTPDNVLAHVDYKNQYTMAHLKDAFSADGFAHSDQISTFGEKVAQLMIRQAAERMTVDGAIKTAVLPQYLSVTNADVKANAAGKVTLEGATNKLCANLSSEDFEQGRLLLGGLDRFMSEAIDELRLSHNPDAYIEAFVCRMDIDRDEFKVKYYTPATQNPVHLNHNGEINVPSAMDEALGAYANDLHLAGDYTQRDYIENDLQPEAYIDIGYWFRPDSTDIDVGALDDLGDDNR